MVNDCCKHRSTLVKCLIFLLTVLIIVLIALFVNLVIRKDDHVCNSEHCIKVSAEIIRYIDQSINPCDDFHTFSCGNFMRNLKEHQPIEPTKELNLMITDFINPDDPKQFAMQKLFYQACANLGAIDLDQEETMLELFYGLGDWPLIRGENWNGTFFDWTEVAKKSRELGLKFNWFLDFSVYEDVNGTGRNVLKIDIPSSLGPLTAEDKRERKNLLTMIADFMGAHKFAHYEAAKTVNFENELGIIAEEHIRRKANDHDVLSLPKLSIDEVHTLWPNIVWLDLINNITGNRMTGSDYIIFNILDYVKDLNKLILGTPKRIVADYMMWKIIEELWPFLSQPIREQFENYTKEILHDQPELDRHKFCLTESKKQFPLIVESVYIRRHVTDEKRSLVREMLSIIQRQYVRLLEDASWMSRNSRRRALAKVQEMRFMIGGPDEVFDQFRFAESLGLYGFAYKSSRNVIDMLNERRIRFYEQYFSALNRRITNNTIRFYESAVNISKFSVINQNTIVIPASILRDSFYNPQLPNYLNYATLAKAIAHEIFDYIYRRDNLTAYLDDENDDNWWIPDAFEQSIKCLTKESSYFHNFELKTRENLAEFIAADVAFESYKEWSRMLSQEFMLPGLKFTPNQLFWIQTSKFSCSKIYSKHDRDNSRFKIIGPLRNSRNFAREYSCPEGSKMNPKKKCRVL